MCSEGAVVGEEREMVGNVEGARGGRVVRAKGF